MTSKDNIIYCTITAVVFVGIVVCSVWSQPNTTNIEMNEGKRGLVEVITPYAPIINALAVLTSTGFIIWTTCFRKTRRDRIDELKLEVLRIVSNVKGHEDWIKAMDLSELQGREGIVKVMDLLKLLHKNYRKKKWCELLPVALSELRNEGHHELLGMPPTTKIIYGPMKIFSGSPTN